MEGWEFCFCHRKLQDVGEQKCTPFVTYLLKLLCATPTFVTPPIKLQGFKGRDDVVGRDDVIIDSASEMTYIVSSGALNSTHSLTS